MQSSDRFFDMANCVKLTPINAAQSDFEGCDAATRDVKLSLRGSPDGEKLDSAASSPQNTVQFAPVVLTLPFGYLPRESDKDKPISKILAQWRRNVDSS